MVMVLPAHNFDSRIGKSITPHHANRGETFAYSTPNYAYSNAQPNMNNMRRRPTFDGSGVGNR